MTQQLDGSRALVQNEEKGKHSETSWLKKHDTIKYY
jgi:hypothetical protein